MAKHPNSRSNKEHATPHKDRSAEEKRKIRGAVVVTGQVMANLPMAVLDAYRAAKHENTPRDNDRYRVEVWTLWVVIFYAFVTTLLACFAHTQITESERVFQSTERTQRDIGAPFVSPTGLQIVPVGSKSPNLWYIHQPWHNTGSTPAVRTNITWGWGFDPPPDGRYVESIKQPETTLPNGDIDSSDLPIELTVLNTVTGKRVLYTWGTIEYKDVFTPSKPHRSRYCVVISNFQVVPLAVQVNDCPGNYKCYDDTCQN